MVLRPVMAPDIPVIVELDRLVFPADEQYERSFYDIMLTQGNFEATAFVDSQGTIVGKSEGKILLDYPCANLR